LDQVADGGTIPVVNPATEEIIGSVAHAGLCDLDAALASAEKGFAAWRQVSAYERSKVMRRAAELLREWLETIAQLMTLEQGKPVAQARLETGVGADIYGRVVPGRAPRLWV
jgi:succinate-semialdehyde dehydrogenase / glutarate-semialdehyde dehydrogenase